MNPKGRESDPMTPMRPRGDPTKNPSPHAHFHQVFFSGGLTATTAATPSIVTGDSGGNNDEDNEGKDQAAPLGVLEHDGRRPVRPTQTRV